MLSKVIENHQDTVGYLILIIRHLSNRDSQKSLWSFINLSHLAYVITNT
jgi:hypothetical protein